MTLFEKLLDYYNINENDYKDLVKDVSLDSFTDGHEFNNKDDAIMLVNESIKNKEKIIIYGDYDADGIMGISILKKMFMYISYPVDTYVPSRYLDGYGITLAKAKEYVLKGYNLVITVDNGIVAFEAIDYLRNNNVKVLVIDHHTIGDKLPNANAILHPVYSRLGEVSSSGAFSAFMFSRYFLNRTDKYLATLASISLVSDMMPMKSYNRNLLRAVKKDYKKDEFLPISLLTDDEEFNETTIGMRVAPKINAIGRMIEDTSVNDIVNFFTTDDTDFILNYFSFICDTNEQRKDLSKKYALEAVDEEVGCAIVKVMDIKEGLIGLVANSLLNKYHVPVIIFTTDKTNNCLKGSCRSVEGINVVEAFNSLSKYMIAYGGHALAGGCSINAKDFEMFKNDFITYIKNIDFKPKEEAYIPLRLIDVNKTSYDLIETFSPFGEEWERPVFEIKDIKTSALNFSKTGEHIISNISFNSKLVGFNFSKNEIMC